MFLLGSGYYRQWLYIVLEYSRSPSPHKMINHHVDCEHCVLDYLYSVNIDRQAARCSPVNKRFWLEKMLSKPFHLKHALWGIIYPDKKAHQNPPMANALFCSNSKWPPSRQAGNTNESNFTTNQFRNSYEVSFTTNLVMVL